jgi:hypothetical protein
MVKHQLYPICVIHNRFKAADTFWLDTIIPIITAKQTWTLKVKILKWYCILSMQFILVPFPLTLLWYRDSFCRLYPSNYPINKSHIGYDQANVLAINPLPKPRDYHLWWGQLLNLAETACTLNRHSSVSCAIKACQHLHFRQVTTHPHLVPRSRMSRSQCSKGNLEVPVYFLKAKQGYTTRNYRKKR